MFGFSLSEILFLAVLALVVIGPKQLPEVARTLARFINELKRSTSAITSEFKIPDEMHPMKPMKKPPTVVKDEQSAEPTPAADSVPAPVAKVVEKAEPTQLELTEQTPHKDSSST